MTRPRKLSDKSRELPIREDGQAYARVVKMVGNGRLLAACADGVERLGIIRGSMRKREWVRVGDTVLVALREYQDTKADVVCVYSDAELRRLRALGEEVVIRRREEEEDGGLQEAVVFEHEDGPEDDGEPVWEDI